MSVISAHIGSKQVTFLIAGVSEGFEIFRFPFVYNPSLQSHFVDEGAFYTEVFKHVMKKFGISHQDCEIFLCSEYRPVLLDMDVKVSTTASELFSDVQDFNIVYANSMPLIPLSRISNPDMISFISNLSLVPGMIIGKTRYRMYKEYVYSSVFVESHSLDPRLPVLFCGDKFSGEYESSADVYQSVLSLIKTLGVFNVSVDIKGTFLPMLLLKKHHPELYEELLLEVAPEVLGTVMRVNKPAECLFKTDSGTVQFFEVTENSLFFVPAEEESKSFVSAKSASIGQYEGFVKGGKLGFVVDTRPIDKGILDSSPEEENLVLFENFKKQIEEAFVRL
jgi:hypothetical protein